MGLDDASAARSERTLLANVAEVAESGRRMARRHGILAESRRLWTEPRGVWRGLTPELGKVKIGASAVTHVHRLVEAALGVVAIKDDAVEGDANNLNHHLDDNADQSPVLESAEKLVVDFALVDLGAGVLRTGPAPHVLIVRVVF